MKNVFIVSLEPIDTRYTGQWYTHIPESIIKYAKEVELKAINVEDISGVQVENKTTPGAFLDFAATNIWKSSQMVKIAELFRDNKVKAGDTFLYTDFWNPTVIQLKYMSELLNIPVKIVGIAHAGSYDPQDFLGRLIGDAAWVRNAEMSFYHCFDHLIFATQFHASMFANVFKLDLYQEQHVKKKIVRSGFPMEYFPSLLEPFSKLEKRNMILFPHRKAPEKQLDIFLDLAKEMPEYEWVVAQDKKLTKDEYHTLLGQSRIVFSANLQETFGIGAIEGLFSNSIPLVPNRLSYTEMYSSHFKYPSKWTINWDSYVTHKQELVELIKSIMNDSVESFRNLLAAQKEEIKTNFINPANMYKVII